MAQAPFGKESLLNAICDTLRDTLEFEGVAECVIEGGAKGGTDAAASAPRRLA